MFSVPFLKVLGRRFNYRANSDLVNADADPSWLLAASIHTSSAHVVFLISEQWKIECRSNRSVGSNRGGRYIKEEIKRKIHELQTRIRLAFFILEGQHLPLTLSTYSPLKQLMAQSTIAMNYLNLMLQDTLIVTKHVQKAAIIDIPTATVKATSIGITFEENEIQYLLSLFNKPMEIRENGIFYEGKIYQCTRAERQSIYAKFGKRGLVLVQTKTLLIVASFSENMFGSVCVEAVEKLAEYFRKKDM